MEPPTCGGSCGHEEVDDDDHDDDYFDCLHEVDCDVNQEQLHTWLDSDCNDPGYEIMIDEDICEMVPSQSCSEEEVEGDEEEEVKKYPVTHSEAVSMFDRCLT